MSFKITYSVLDADMTEIHKAFDTSLQSVRGNLGNTFPYWTQGKAQESGSFLENYNPAKTDELLAKFHQTPVSEIDAIMNFAEQAYKKWRLTPWKERCAIFEKAADLISERRMEISAIMALETGKNRMESLGDVEESADLFRWNAKQLHENNGYTRSMGNLSPNEKTTDTLKPYGVFVVISPFNFPMALAAGMGSGAMLGGNTVVFKPSQETPWSALKLFEVLKDAGLPEGVLQLVYGSGSELGKGLTGHPKTAGVAFTGSYEVGMQIQRQLAAGPHPKPCMLEMGGKNPTIIRPSADLDKAITGCFKSAFGLTGQKCSALSRVYVHSSLKDKFIQGLVEKMKGINIGDPTDKDVYVGPLISETAVKTHLNAIELAKKDGKILAGGEDIRSKSEFAKGYFVQPTLAELPKDHRLFRDELFTPFLVVAVVDSMEEAVAECNKANLGLTGGIFSTDKKEIQYFWDHMETGVLYANRESGATTGAWPGVNPFCGWKGSGGSGRGICGPYYTARFMQEQSHTLME